MANKSVTDQNTNIREAAETDLEVFIRLISPKQVLGSIHQELIRWMTRSERKNHQLVLLPRDHQKSRLAAYRAAWVITRRPDIRILYISATANLAEKQLKFIKDLLTSPIYTRYWPEMVHPEEGKREKWTNSEISVDHPKRKEEGVRDPTIFTGGLTTGLTGMHCDIAILDDTVVQENAYTNEGREKVKAQYSLLASIEGTDSEEWTYGTRYDPNDLYGEQLTMQEEQYDEDGNISGYEPIYEVFERTVEDSPFGDGSGTYLWPRQMRSDGKWFGFDQKQLAIKRAKYLNKGQFRAQYYNDPNDVTDSPVNRSLFQYYDQQYVEKVRGKWTFKNRPLNVYASIDFAYSKKSSADYTALVVIGMDAEQNIYVLAIERIRTDRISDYYDLILRHHIKWDFRKLRAEVTAAQKSIVKELKYSYLMPNGIMLSVEENSPTRYQGSKEERISAMLQPRYENKQIWHYLGGECSNLEEELVLRRPPHDDIKDALASVIEIAVPPMSLNANRRGTNIVFNQRFGGVSI